MGERKELLNSKVKEFHMAKVKIEERQHGIQLEYVVSNSTIECNAT